MGGGAAGVGFNDGCDIIYNIVNTSYAPCVVT